MKPRFIVITLVLACLATFCNAQDTPPAVAPSNTFSMSAQAIALPGGKQTVAGTVMGATFNVTDKLALRSDNLLVPGANLQGYFGGFNYVLPALSNKLNSVSATIDGNHLQVYLTASAGIDRISSGVGGSFTEQHYSFLGGGGLRYDPAGNRKFSINTELRWAKLPGYVNSTIILSVSPTLRF